MMARRRETGSGARLLADPPRPAATPVAAPRTSRRVWLLFVLLVVLGGAAAAWRFGVIHLPWLPR